MDDLSHSVISTFLDVTSLASAVAAMRLNIVEERLQYWLNWVVIDPVGVLTDQPMDLRTRAEIANLRPAAEQLGITINPQAWRPCPIYAHAAIDWAFDHSHVYGRSAFIALAKAYWANTVNLREVNEIIDVVHQAGVPTQGLGIHLGRKQTLAAQFQQLAQARSAHIGDTPVLSVGGTLLPGLLDEEAYVEIIASMT